ncbi:MAG: magnesium transporter CorA family protein [Candidatus Levybacteria bacterium]|nr:magnesium transporter CorA family protein [Candidatus Levybacteria bacterium]
MRSRQDNMNKMIGNTLEKTLRDLQILLGKPQKELAGKLGSYISFFTHLGRPLQDQKGQNVPRELEAIKNNGVTWIDIINPTRHEISLLAQSYPLHPLHLEDVLSRFQPVKIEDEKEYLFLLFRLPSLHAKDEEKKTITDQISIFVGKEFVVTMHSDATDSISEIFTACKTNPKKREEFMRTSTIYLFYRLLDVLSDNLAPLRNHIAHELEEVEDIVFNDKVSAVQITGKLRREITRTRRDINALRKIIAELPAHISRFTSEDLNVYFDNITDRVNKTWDALEEAKEIVEIYKDADYIFSTEKTNRILTVLTVIFTFSIPATVIGAFYGMNIRLPGGIEAGNWTFLGPYTTFIMILLISITIILLMALYFRRRNWF